MNQIKNICIIFIGMFLFSGCGIPAIHQAISTKNNQQLETLVKNGDDIEENYSDYLPWTPLIHAIQTGNTEAVKLLINRGADVHKEYAGLNSLFLAASQGNEEMIKILLAKGMDINSKNSLGETILFPVARTGKLLVVKYLLDNGADINAVNNQKANIMFSAVTSGNVELIDFLIKKGLNVNETTLTGISPIFNAAYFGHSDALKFLIKNNANIHQKTTDNKTPLFNVTIMIKSKADSIKIWSTYPSLAELSEKERKNIENLISCWKILIDAKVNPDILDNTNKKALDYLTDNPNYYNILAQYTQEKRKVIVAIQTAEEIQTKINNLIAKEDFESLKTLTEQNPNYVNYISDTELRLMLTGPKGMKVGDLVKHSKGGKSETIIISLIKQVEEPYKKYTLDEIDILSKMGLSDKVISAMIDVTTDILKDDKKRKEQEVYLTEQKKIAEQKSQPQVIYQTVNNGNNNNQSNPLLDKVQDKLIEKGAEKVFKQLLKW